MGIKKLLYRASSLLLALGFVLLVNNGTVAAQSPAVSVPKLDGGLQHIQFSATGFPTAFQTNITNPPQIGQVFHLEESLKNTSGTVIGSNVIDCKVIGFTLSTLVFAYTGTFTFNDGSTLKVKTVFNFDPANLPAKYDAFIVSGTGTYAGAFGVIHVTDPGPGNPTGYGFDFYTLSSLKA